MFRLLSVLVKERLNLIAAVLARGGKMYIRVMQNREVVSSPSISTTRWDMIKAREKWNIAFYTYLDSSPFLCIVYMAIYCEYKKHRRTHKNY